MLLSSDCLRKEKARRQRGTKHYLFASSPRWWWRPEIGADLRQLFCHRVRSNFNTQYFSCRHTVSAERSPNAAVLERPSPPGMGLGWNLGTSVGSPL
jgi:hypothetical protein